MQLNFVIILLGKSFKINTIELILISCFSEESSECFIRFYNIFKEKYKFIPELITNDFKLTNLSTLEKVYNNDKVIIVA